MASVDAEVETVILVDDDGTRLGTAPKADVHHGATPLHLAFSCHVRDDAGRVLVTRRALTKRTWPGVWTNSVCGHPAPGEDPADAVRRRAQFELGLELVDLELVLPDYRYRAVDASGVVENELCPVWTARAADPRPTANPDEVMDAAWVEPDALRRAVDAAPFAFSPWLVGQAARLPLLGGLP